MTNGGRHIINISQCNDGICQSLSFKVTPTTKNRSSHLFGVVISLNMGGQVKIFTPIAHVS